MGEVPHAQNPPAPAAANKTPKFESTNGMLSNVARTRPFRLSCLLQHQLLRTRTLRLVTYRTDKTLVNITLIEHQSLQMRGI